MLMTAEADPTTPARSSRRDAIRELITLALLAPAPWAVTGMAQAAQAFPDTVTMLIAGPGDGRLARWAQVMAPVLARTLSPGGRLQQRSAGGVDGVTGANQFDARVAPDGATVLLVPGEAGLAWLAGDPRARFDAAHWVPVLAGVGAGVLTSRIQAAALGQGSWLRVAVNGPTGPELAALLGIELMGLRMVPVAGIAGSAACRAALAAGHVDAVFVHGPTLTQQLVELALVGAAPLFSLGAPDATDGLARHPLLPNVPTLPELAASMRGGALTGPLFAAWQAVAAAAQIEFAVVLPQLTPAALVALWRRAGLEAASSAELQAALADVRAVGAPAASAVTAPVAASAAALIELRRWLAHRLNWQPT